MEFALAGGMDGCAEAAFLGAAASPKWTAPMRKAAAPTAQDAVRRQNASIGIKKDPQVGITTIRNQSVQHFR